MKIYLECANKYFGDPYPGHHNITLENNNLVLNVLYNTSWWKIYLRDLQGFVTLLNVEELILYYKTLFDTELENE